MQSSPENPIPLRTVNAKIAEWINRLGTIWVEGQVTQVTARDSMAQAFIELRDVDQKLSARVVATPEVVADVRSQLTDGARIVALVKPQFWAARGQLVLRAHDIRTVGIGDLLLRIEKLRQQLATEGLFASHRKKDLPFLPNRIGLICGRNSAAERDVVENVTRRWPRTRFEIAQVPVQGAEAVEAIIAALARLDADSQVDVIIVARGGGSVEDLLAFSEERLVRAVATATTPIVSAIGHEQDTPLLDYVSDVRASTPTDAARLVVPDVVEQLSLVGTLRQRAERSILARIDREETAIARVRHHPLLASPVAVVDDAISTIRELARRSATSLLHQLELASTTTSHQRSALRAYSPAATLERGYAIATFQGSVLRDTTTLEPGDQVSVRLHHGSIAARVERITGKDSNDNEPT